MVGVRNGDQRGQVQHRVAALHGRAHAVGVAHVAGERLEFTLDILAAAVKPAPRIERVVQHEGANVVTRAHQRLGEVGTDKTVGAGDQNLFHTNSFNNIHLTTSCLLNFLFDIR